MAEYIEVRSGGKFLFEYDPEARAVRIRRGGREYQVNLDAYDRSLPAGNITSGQAPAEGNQQTAVNL